MSFYTPEGLRAIALLIDDTIAKKLYSQNSLAEVVGVAGNTIKGIRRNRTNIDEVHYKPDPDILLALAPLLIDPRSGKPFESEEFLRIARGHVVLDPALYVEADAPFVAEIKRWMQLHGKDELAFARESKIPVRKFRELLQGRFPTLFELMQLGAYMFEDQDPAPLAKLLGIDLNAPIDKLKPRKSI